MKLDHIGIAVEDLEKARRIYGELLGLEVSEPELLPERKLRICMVNLGVGDACIELLEPTEPDTPVDRFLKKRGPGVHHICYRVDDVAAKLAELKSAGVKLVDEQPRPGAHNTLVAFIHPSSTGGVLTELSQPA